MVPADPPPTGRLGDKVTPRAYQMELEVDPEQSNFRGRVRIDVAVAEPVSSFWLHGRGITVVRSVVLLGAGAAKRELPLRALVAPKDSELLGYAAHETIPRGDASLEFEFTAVMGRDTGLFRQRHEGIWYAITDFEPIDARLAIPCFDDPRFKVPWELSLVIPESLSAYANAPQSSEELLGNGTKRVRFERTRPIPSYLVAFAVGPFEVVEAPGGPVPIRILALQGKASWAGYARDIAPPLLGELVRYFGGPVPFPKVDFVAVPSFSGAMENPGLITVSANILLQDPARDRIERRRLAALVIAHELSHLWLGDLVTMRFWDDLWLNEGAATWLAAKILDQWSPAQKWSVQDATSMVEAMDVDSELDAPPVRHTISGEGDIRDAFDPISYKKGGALFGMLEAWIGEASFREHLLAYVAAHADGNVTARDFLAAFPRSANRRSATWLPSFLNTPGVPDVSARLSCSGSSAHVDLSQSRYLPLAAAAAASAEQRAPTWHIPICVRYGDRTGVDRACTVLNRPTGTLALSRCPVWFYPNADERGYYRVRLPEKTLRDLAGLDRPPLSEREVVGLTANTVAMLRAGEVELADALPLLRALARDRNLEATRLITTAVAYLERAVITDKRRAGYRAFVRRLYGKRARVLGLHRMGGEDEELSLMRPVVLALVGRYGRDPWTLARAKRLVARWLDSGEGIDPALLGTIVTIAASAGGRPLFERFSRALDEADTQTVEGRRRRQVLLAGLGSFSDPTLVRRAVDRVHAEDALPTDLVFLFQAIFQNPDNAALGLDLLEDAQKRAGDRSADPRALYRTAYLALLAGQHACSDEEWRRIEALAQTATGGAAPDWMADGLSEIERDVDECAAFRARHQTGANAFFK